MGCDACEYACELKDLEQYYYRWKHATVGIIACRDHAKEIMEALNDAQSQAREATPNE